MGVGGFLGIASRRDFLLGGAAFAMGCAGLAPSSPAGKVVRAPAVGQTWTYAKRDSVTGSRIDTQVDRVSAVGQVVEVESRFELAANKPSTYPSWSAHWLEKYVGDAVSAGSLPTEIQAPWGMVLVDPHWSELQVYEEPIPLWPTQLVPGWSSTVNTLYTTPESPDELPWQLTMHAQRWESVSVPAGRFTVLRYANVINFRYTNVSERDAAQRLETILLAPEIGRWVARESFGTFYQDVGERFHEQSYRG
jgi:hypothetical protein